MTGQNLSKREKRLIILAVCFVTLFSLYRWVFSPQWEGYRRVKDDIKNKQALLSKTLSAIESSRKLARENKEIAASLNVPKNFHIVNQYTVLLRLDSLTTEKDLELLFYNPVPPTPGLMPSEAVEVKVTGRYNKLLDFFEILDNEPYRTKIEVYYIRSLSSQENITYTESSVYASDIPDDTVVTHFKLEIYDMPEIGADDGSGTEPDKKAVSAKPKAKRKKKKPAVNQTIYGIPKPPVYNDIYRTSSVIGTKK